MSGAIGGLIVTMTRRRPLMYPFKVLTTLLYSDLSWITRTGDGTLVVPSGRLATRLGITVSRLLDYYRWLDSACLLDRLEINSGYAVIKPAIPVGLSRIVSDANTMTQPPGAIVGHGVTLPDDSIDELAIYVPTSEDHVCV